MAAIASIIFLSYFIISSTTETFLYRISVGKGKFYDTKSKQHFYIPSGQCTGFFNLTNMCFSHSIPEAIKVSVKDNSSLPNIQMDDRSNNITIFRNGHCDGLAYVTLKFECQGEFHSNNKIPRRLRSVSKNKPLQAMHSQYTYKLLNLNKDVLGNNIESNVPYNNPSLGNINDNLLSDNGLNKNKYNVRELPNIVYQNYNSHLLDNLLTNHELSTKKSEDNLSLLNHETVETKSKYNLSISDNNLLNSSIKENSLLTGVHNSSNFMRDLSLENLSDANINNMPQFKSANANYSSDFLTSEVNIINLNANNNVTLLDLSKEDMPKGNLSEIISKTHLPVSKYEQSEKNTKGNASNELSQAKNIQNEEKEDLDILTKDNLSELGNATSANVTENLAFLDHYYIL